MARSSRLLSTLLLGACGAQLDPQPDALPLDEVRSVELVGSLVDVEVYPSDLLTVDASVTWRRRADLPELAHEVVDGKLLVRGACPENARSCAVQHRLGVPPDVDVITTLDRGSLDASGVAFLDARVNGTALYLTDLPGVLRLAAFNGDVDGRDLAAREIDITTTGTVDLGLIARPETLTIEANQSALLRVPGGSYRLSLEAALGEVLTDGVFHDDRSPSLLSARVRVGNLMVIGEPTP